MKSKLSAIIDERTILNFKFIIKLLKRYRFITLTTPFVVMALVGYFYKFQNEIYSGTISFRYVAESDISPISAIRGDNKVHSGQSEVLGIINSTSFLQALSSDVKNDFDLGQLNLNSVFSRNNLSYSNLVKHCTTLACEFEFLRGRLPEFIEIHEDLVTKNKYNVTIKTLSRFTTDRFIKYVVNNFKKHRLDKINFQLEHQINTTQNLLDKQKEKKVIEKIVKNIEGIKVFKASLKSIERKYSYYDGMLSKKRIGLEQEQISLKYTNSTLKREITSKDKSQWKKSIDLKLKREMLVADITALEHTIGKRTDQDNTVINELKVELLKINIEIRKIKTSKSLFVLEKFQNEKRKAKGLIEFNISVLTDQISQLEIKSEEIKKKKNEVIAIINNKEDFFQQNKSSLAFYKLLQEKLLQIKLVKASVVSDIIFDDFLSVTKQYKKYSLISVLPFSVVLGVLITILLIVIRYFFDKRILDKEEFEVIFDDISFIGEVPKFD